MSEQPAVQPPTQPPHQPTSPPTQPMPAAERASADAPKPNVWRRATSTTGRRVALALSAGALVALMVLGIAVAGILVLRHHDRVDLLGLRQDGYSRGQDGRDFGNGHGNGPGANGNRNKDNNDDNQRRLLPGMPGMPGPGMPGMPGGRAHVPGWLGNLGAALHGEVTATVNGSVQTLVFQRGEITAVSATSITLKSSDGFVGTYGRNATTKSNGAPLVKGGHAFVVARASDKVALRTIATPAGVDVAPNDESAPSS